MGASPAIIRAGSIHTIPTSTTTLIRNNSTQSGNLPLRLQRKRRSMLYSGKGIDINDANVLNSRGQRAIRSNDECISIKKSIHRASIPRAEEDPRKRPTSICFRSPGTQQYYERFININSNEAGPQSIYKLVQ
eukprot:GEZU01008972.1.p1 GENE.GEZU01008972.1~~GEZU01008972.1.p1  ORF type:complete len:133 (-),score=5.45 GEZU01008972.1:338-736(-)